MPNVTINKMYLYDPLVAKPKPSKDNTTFSEDVYFIDENNLHGTAYYSFKERQWHFYKDPIVDYNEAGAIEWRWYYPPINACDIEF